MYKSHDLYHARESPLNLCCLGHSCGATLPEPEETVQSKMTPAQSDEEVNRQLQANMILLSSCLLRRKIEENPGDADSINLLTCYGLQLGSTYPVKIIKQ